MGVLLSHPQVYLRVYTLHTPLLPLGNSNIAVDNKGAQNFTQNPSQRLHYYVQTVKKTDLQFFIQDNSRLKYIHKMLIFVFDQAPQKHSIR